MRLLPTHDTFEAVLDRFGYSLGYSEASEERRLIRRREVVQLRKQVDRSSAELVALKVVVEKLSAREAAQEAHVDVGPKAMQKVDTLATRFQDLQAIVEELRDDKPVDQRVAPDLGQQAMERVGDLSAQLLGLQAVVDQMRGGSAGPQPDEAEARQPSQLTLSDPADTATHQQTMPTETPPADAAVAPAAVEAPPEEVPDPAATSSPKECSDVLGLFSSEQSLQKTEGKSPAMPQSILNLAGDRGNEPPRGEERGFLMSARRWLRHDDGQGDGPGEPESSTPAPSIARERLFQMLDDQRTTKATSPADGQDEPTEQVASTLARPQLGAGGGV